MNLVYYYVPLRMCGLRMRIIYRAAAFDVTGSKTTETPSVIYSISFIRLYSDLRNSSSSELTYEVVLLCQLLL